jgi:hypothetical protein
MEEEIKGYILRAIPDIARKCNVKANKVIETIKKLYDENKFH